ncbi:MAG: hypothetical protein ACI8P9_001185 [Parasphingorhabdus sp.]|jgi:hypothetical protein
MLSLRDFQEQFHSALSGDISEPLKCAVVAAGLPAERRLQVYRNNMQASLTESLACTYPAIAKLVGEDYFNTLARLYIKAHPSQSGDLHQFGNRLADYLKDYQAAARLPYLPDLARFEWCYHEIFHAVEESSLGIDSLNSLSVEQLSNIRFHLHPATRLVASSYPLVSIWQLAGQDSSSPGTIQLDQGGEFVALARRNYEISFQILDEHQFRFLTLIIEDQPLYKILDKIGDGLGDFQRFLSDQFALGNFTGYSI